MLAEQSKEFSQFLYKYMELMSCGSVGKTATEFGVSRQQFYKWLNGGIPAIRQLRNISTVISKTTNIDRKKIVLEILQVIQNSLNENKAG